MKYVIALVLLASQLAFAGIPPTTSKGAGDSAFKTTFNYDFGSILLSHSGTTVTIGTIPASMLAIAASAPLTLTNGTFGIPVATSGANGYLASGDWSTFNNKQPTIGVSAPLAETSGTLISIPVATSGANGYLSSTDWSTFNGKQNLLVFSSPLALNGTTASLNKLAPLTTTGGSLSIPVATSSVDGYLSQGDWTTFNNKQATVSATAPVVFSANTISINKLAPLTTTNGSLSIPVATSSVDGYLAQGDFTTFSNKQATISATAPIQLIGTAVSLGTVLAANGGIGLTAAIATGNFLWSNGSVYSAGTIAQGTGITVSQDGAGKYTIAASASSAVPATMISTGTSYVVSNTNVNQTILTTGSIAVSLYSLGSSLDGQSVTIKKTDTSLFNLATVTAATGEGIALSASNAASMYLSTPGDTVTLTGRGTLWYVTARNCSMPMTLLGTTVIAGITTNPTKGTIAAAYTNANSIGKLDEVWIGRGGGPCNKATIRTAFYQSLGTGSAAGSGDYITRFDTYTLGFDVTKSTRNNLAGDTGQNTSEGWSAGARFGLGQKGNCWAGTGAAGNTLIGSPVIWSGTMASSANAVYNGFRCYGEDSTAGGVWGSGGYPITTDNMWFGSDFEAEMNSWSE